MLIRKTFQGEIPENKIVDAYTNSNTDAYSCDYINGNLTYSTDEVDTGMIWIDGRKIYRKVIQASRVSVSANTWKTITTIVGINEIINHSIIFNYGILGAYLCRYDNNNIQIYTNDNLEVRYLIIDYTKK